MSDNQYIDVPGSDIPRTVTNSEDFDKPAGRGTILDQLRAEIEKEVTRPEIEIAVPEREGVTVKFSPNITTEQLKAWRRNSTNKKTDELDSVKFSCYVVGQTVTGIYFNGEIVEDDSGVPITFASPAILEMTKTTRPLPDAIRAFYAVDPHLENTALKILDHAGYGEDVDTEDPTMG